MVLPHSKGSLPVRIKFKKSFDLDAQVIPKLKKAEPLGMGPMLSEKPKNEKADAGKELIASASEDQKKAA